MHSWSGFQKVKASSLLAADMTDLFIGSTCLCRPLYKVPADTDESAQSNSTSVPSVASPASSKVQKPGKRQSHMQAAPENIAKALEAMPDNLKQEEDVSEGSAPLLSHHTGQHDSHSPGMQNSFSASSMTSQAVRNTAPATVGSSCCSQKPQPPTVAATGGGSCCGSTTATPLATHTHSSNSNTLKTQPAAWNDLSYMNLATPQLHTWQNQMANQARLLQHLGMHNGQTQSNYMANYASTAPYGNMMDQLGVSQSAMPSFASNHSQNPGYTPTTLGSDPCHDCKCGEDCQCLGCAAHPFNNTTRQHVQEMGVLMTFDGDEHTPEAIANAYQSPPFHGSNGPASVNYFMQQSSSMDNAVSHNTFDPYSDPNDPNSAMPSGYSSPLPPDQPLNQQLMHPSEYYTLEYPVGIPSACSDVTGSCQCGNDCSCVGCLTHSGHNGMPLEAPIPGSSVVTTVEQQASSHAPPTTTSSGHTSRVPVLENVSMPCLSPRTLETSMI